MSEIQRNDPIEKDPVTMDDGGNMNGWKVEEHIGEGGDDVTPLDTGADEAKLTPEQQEVELLEAAIYELKQAGMPEKWVNFIKQEAQILPPAEAIQGIKNALANWEARKETQGGAEQG